MKKLNLKKPLALYEDFAASDLSKPNQTVTPAGKTETASITVDKVVAKPTGAETIISSGDKVRAEIVQDVDAILTNLEALSKSITESVLLEFNVFAEELTEAALNEAEEGFMAKIMKSIASAKSYSTVMGTYPTMKKNLLKAEITKTQKLKELAVKSDEMQADMYDKLSAKSKAEIDAAENLAAKQKLRAKRDALQDKAKAQADVQLKTATAKLTAKLDNTIRDITAKITKVEKDNPIESEDLKLRWAEQKLSIDDKMAMEKIEKNGAIELEYAKGGDKEEEIQKRVQERIAKQSKKQKEYLAEEKAKISEDLKSYSDKEAKEGEGDKEEMKEAKTKVREFIKAHQEYLAKLEGTDFELLNKKKPTDEEKVAIKAAKKDTLESQKKYNALKEGLSATTFADAEGTDKDKGEETLKAILDSTKAQLKDFESDMDAMSTDQDLNDDDKKFDEKKVKAAIDAAQGELDALPVETSPKDTAVIRVKLLTAKIAMAEGKKDPAEDIDALKRDLAAAVALSKSKPQTNSVDYDLDPNRILVEASLNGLMSYTEDDYKYLKAQAKKLGVKISIDKDPFGDGYDELNYSGDKAAVMKLAGISGHADQVGDDNAYQLEEAEVIEEGLHPKLKKAMKAVEKGETVYGENVRFPGRFKIIKMGELFATVDYEDGTEPMEMAAMNIRIDSLQFEAVEIEEAKEELPKKIKLYEGMSVADKFKALM